MVEFALAIPILLLVIIGIFEAGRALYVYQAISSASREAARLGSGASEATSTPPYANCTAIRNRAVEVGRPGSVTAANVTIWYERTVPHAEPGLGYCGSVLPAAINTGDRITVRVTGTFQPGQAMPIFQFPTLTFTTLTRRTIIKGVNLTSWLPTQLEISLAPTEAD